MQERLIPVEVVAAKCAGRPAVEGGARPLVEIVTPGGFTLRFADGTPVETVACLLDVISRGPLPPSPHAGAGSC